GLIPGLAYAIFGAGLAALLVVCHPDTAFRRRALPGWVLAIAGLAALVEHAQALSITFAFIGLALFALAVRRGFSTDPLLLVPQAVLVWCHGLSRLIRDRLLRAGLLALQVPGASLFTGLAILGTSAVFIALLAAANPLIERAIENVGPMIAIDTRSLIWFCILFALTWALLTPSHSPRLGRLRRALSSHETGPSTLTRWLARTFPQSSVLIALVLFNAIFAVQTGLDLTVFGLGAGLPEGLSYAEYAHRGAYPLIATALLAGAIVLFVMRDGGPGRGSRAVRWLIIIWLLQNLVLVGSSLWRLAIYIDVYALTYLRVSAFIWMVLVGVGIALIFARLAFNKSNMWLLRANLAVLLLTFYACCFVDIGRLIAHYNVDRAIASPTRLAALDLGYLEKRIGTSAYPALQKLDRALTGRGEQVSLMMVRIAAILWEFDYEMARREKDWRTQSRRFWKLKAETSRLDRARPQNPPATPAQ
ncbi:MAG: DUF4173 domain-containing protein, partial [Pseudomonadota bacterium]